MAVKHKFTCTTNDDDFITLSSNKDIRCNEDSEIDIWLQVYQDDKKVAGYFLDIPTAIKLHKTLRVEIAKIKEGGSDE